jgi:steroid delta-isomerase-like uncharacterized protein
MSELADLVRRNFDAIESSDWDGVAANFDPSCDFSAPGYSARGGEAAAAWMRPFVEAFPDIKHRVIDPLESDGRIAFELEITGTHTAPLVSPQGEVPPTGQQIRLAAANLWTVDGGKIASYHIYFDQMSFMGQLGLGG